MTLAAIVGMEGKIREIEEVVETKKVEDYILELIRVSRMYKFEVKFRNMKDVDKKPDNPKAGPPGAIDNIDKRLEKAESMEGIRQYVIPNLEGFNEDVKVVYNNGEVKINDVKEYSIEPKKKFEKQELRDKTGFYQEKSYLTKVRVQLWPEHLPYDHFKRKRAFLFC